VQSAAAAIKFSSHFRLAGLNYLEMINIASTSLRTVMKEPARTEALSAAKFHYRQYTYENAVESEPGGWASPNPSCFLCVCVCCCLAGVCGPPSRTLLSGPPLTVFPVCLFPTAAFYDEAGKKADE
jgi:hypothetical protein